MFHQHNILSENQDISKRVNAKLTSFLSKINIYHIYFYVLVMMPIVINACPLERYCKQNTNKSLSFMLSRSSQKDRLQKM